MRRKRRMMVNQPPHREWRKRARRAAAGKRQGGKWSHCGRKGSRHQWAAEEMWRREGGGCGAADSSWLCLMMFWIFCVPFLQA